MTTIRIDPGGGARARIHVCLVSGQPTPNLTPLLDRAFRPEEAVFLVSPDMREQAEWLKQAVQPAGVGVRFHEIDDAWDIEHVRDRVFALLDETETGDVALNATGGTKPMSIAAYEVFRGLDLPIFYVHPETDRLIWMHPADRPPQEIEDRVRLPQFLRAHGVLCGKPRRTHPPAGLRELTRNLVAGIGRFASALGTLNYMAFQANRSLRAPFPEGKRGWRELNDLLEIFAREGLLDVAGDHITFRDENARSFVNGGWLEQHVFACVQGLRSRFSGIHDVACGLEVARGDVRNELDVAFLHNNRLHIIECKTKKFSGGEDAHAVYKLDALTDAMGGIRARSMLVSYRPLAAADAERAKRAGISLCAGEDIRILERRLEDWLGLEAPPCRGGLPGRGKD